MFKKILRILFAVCYFGLLIYITFLARRRRTGVDYHQYTNLNVFKKLQDLQNIYTLSVNDRTEMLIDIFGNIALFIPFTWALCLLAGKVLSPYKLLACIFFASLGIETIQYIFNVGVFDLGDVLLNTIGGITGLLFLKIFRRFHFIS